MKKKLMRKPRRIREKKHVAKRKLLAMILEKRYWDLLDLAMYWGQHPASLRKALAASRIPENAIVNSGYEYIFDRDIILKLPRPKIGRPRKNNLV